MSRTGFDVRNFVSLSPVREYNFHVSFLREGDLHFRICDHLVIGDRKFIHRELFGRERELSRRISNHDNKMQITRERTNVAHTTRIIRGTFPPTVSKCWALMLFELKLRPKVTSKQVDGASKSFYAWEKNPKRILVDPDAGMTYLWVIIAIRIFNWNLKALYLRQNLYLFVHSIFLINFIHSHVHRII